MLVYVTHIDIEILQRYKNDDRSLPVDEVRSLAGLAFNTTASCSLSVYNIFLISWQALCVSVISAIGFNLRGLFGARQAITSCSENPLRFISPSGVRLLYSGWLKQSKRGAIVKQESGKLIGMYPANFPCVTNHRSITSRSMYTRMTYISAAREEFGFEITTRM